MNHSTFFIRRANPSEATLLSGIAKAAQASWGYPEAWLRAWEQSLTLTESFLRYSIALVAEMDQTLTGFWCHQLALSKNDVATSLLFVHPDYIGQGCGRALWHTLQSILAHLEIHSISIQAEPKALGFYLKLGGQKIDEMPSPLIPGRTLPIVKLPVQTKYLKKTSTKDNLL